MGGLLTTAADGRPRPRHAPADGIKIRVDRVRKSKKSLRQATKPKSARARTLGTGGAWNNLNTELSVDGRYAPPSWRVSHARQNLLMSLLTTMMPLR